MKGFKVASTPSTITHAPTAAERMEPTRRCITTPAAPPRKNPGPKPSSQSLGPAICPPMSPAGTPKAKKTTSGGHSSPAVKSPRVATRVICRMLVPKPRRAASGPAQTVAINAPSGPATRRNSCRPPKSIISTPTTMAISPPHTGMNRNTPTQPTGST